MKTIETPRHRWPATVPRRFGGVREGFRLSTFLGGLLAALWLGETHSLEGAGVRDQVPAKVIVYTSQDQVYAERILQQFERRLPVKISAVYDSEAVKTVGLANRLLAERKHPQADVFWSNEELRTRQLAAQGVFRETNGWAAMGYRSRRIAINTNFLQLGAAPRTLIELTNVQWRGKVALAYPLFGTTATHFLVLRQHWGAEKWEAWCRGLAANKPFIVDGNSVAARFLARGEAWIALTDSDDVAAEQREGAPLAVLPMNEETLLIPNTIAMIRQAPHPEAAERVCQALQSREVAETLITAKALEGHAASEVTIPTLRPDWEKLLSEIEPATMVLRKIFLR